MSHTLRPGLPPLPPKMAHLPIDERGYPVPFFVEYVDGKPDHRIMDAKKLPLAVAEKLCWLCGGPLGAYKCFVVGPMCSITGSISEPPSHRECARYACMACPWMTRPHAKRREVEVPHQDQAGLPIMRNPGAVGIWSTKSFRIYRTGRGGAPGNDGLLFAFGPPEGGIEWYAEGRLATRAEVDESISTGIHLLVEQAEQQDREEGGERAMHELDRLRAISKELLDAQVWPSEPGVSTET